MAVKKTIYPLYPGNSGVPKRLDTLSSKFKEQLNVWKAGQATRSWKVIQSRGQRPLALQISFAKEDKDAWPDISARLRKAGLFFETHKPKRSVVSRRSPDVISDIDVIGFKRRKKFERDDRPKKRKRKGTPKVDSPGGDDDNNE